MKLDEFHAKHRFGCGYCCGNCVNYTPKSKDLRDLSFGSCSHPDFPEDQTVACNHYCVEFKSTIKSQEKPTEVLRGCVIETERGNDK